MDIIKTIDLLSERIKNPVQNITASDYHTCRRNMWLKHRNVKSIQHDIRADLLNDNMKKPVINWILTASRSDLICADRALSDGHVIDGIISKDGIYKLLAVFLYSSDDFKIGLKYQDEARTRETLRLSTELSKKGATLEIADCYLMNRDTFELQYIEIPNEPERINGIHDAINDVMQESELPPVQESENCAVCNYKDFCFSGDIANVSCRTCADYAHNSVCKYGTSTCEKHLYHPQILGLAGYKVIGADQTRRQIEYDQFTNTTAGDSVPGEACFTSRELFSAAGRDLHTDPVLLELMARFDGRLAE